MSDTSAIEDRTKTRFWNQLLDLIAKGNVVPIVGEELLQLPGEPEGTTLYQTLGQTLRSSLWDRAGRSVQGKPQRNGPAASEFPR